MAKHTLTTCDACSTVFFHSNWSETTELHMKLTGGIQVTLYRELCLPCAQRVNGFIEDFLQTKQYTTTAAVTITNEQVKNATLVQVYNVRKGE